MRLINRTYAKGGKADYSMFPDPSYLVHPSQEQLAYLLNKMLPETTPLPQYKPLPPGTARTDQKNILHGYNNSVGDVGEPDFSRGGNCFGAGGPTYGLSSIPQVATNPQPSSPPMGMSSPYVSSGMPTNSAIAPVNGAGIPSIQPSYAPIVTPNSAVAPPATAPTTAAPTTPTPLAVLGPSQLAKIPTKEYVTAGVDPSNPDFALMSSAQQRQLLKWYNTNANGQPQVTPLTGSMPRKNGGGVEGLAGGGIPTSEAMDPWYARAEERGMMQPEGLIVGHAGGRTDVHNINVPSGSYIIPSDVVSGLSEGNTLSGAAVMDRMMHSNPYGVTGGARRGSMGPPRPPAPLKESRGGRAKDHGGTVPIVVAGGEFLIHPQTIIKKFGSLEKGHSTLDRFVVNTRKETAKTMLKLPGPKGSKK